MHKTVNSQYSVCHKQRLVGTNRQPPQPTHLPPLPTPPYFPNIYKNTHFPKLFDHHPINTPLLSLFIFLFPLSKKKKKKQGLPPFGRGNCPAFLAGNRLLLRPRRRVRGGLGVARRESCGGSRSLCVM